MTPKQAIQNDIKHFRNELKIVRAEKPTTAIGKYNKMNLIEYYLGKIEESKKQFYKL